MEIKLSVWQKEIAREARRFCEKESPMEFVRSMAEDDRGITDEFWAKMVKMDWMALGIPEEYGGVSEGIMDLALVLEEMGRFLVPGPFFSTVMLAGEAILQAGSAAQKKSYLPKIATGELKGTLALHEPDSGANPDYIRMPATKHGDGYLLSGTKLFVPDAHLSDVMVVAARTAEGGDISQGISLFLVDGKAEGVSVSSLPTFDGTRKLCAVEFEGVSVGREGLLGGVDEGWPPLCRALQRAQVGLCAESLGGAQRAMEMTVQHAKNRIQFDQPIGAFQAVKHRCAQMFVDVESARSLNYWAAWAQDDGDEKEAALAASVAKVYCSEVYRSVATGGIQVFGGMGFSWEQDIHLYLRRAKANEMALGDPVYHRDRIVQLLAG